MRIYPPPPGSLRFLVSTNKDVLQKWGKLVSDSHNPRELAGRVDPTIIYDMHGRVVATLCGEQARAALLSLSLFDYRPRLFSPSYPPPSSPPSRPPIPSSTPHAGAH